MLCSKCGAEVKEGSEVCPDCGADLAVDASASSEAAETSSAKSAADADATPKNEPQVEVKKPIGLYVLITGAVLAFMMSFIVQAIRSMGLM